MEHQADSRAPQKNKPTSYCALVLLPGSMLWGTGHLPFTLEGKALLSAASLTWRCSSGTVTGPHLVCTAHSPVQYLCGSFSFRRYWFVAHCLWVSHTSKITKKKENSSQQLKYSHTLVATCAACHQLPLLRHHGTQLSEPSGPSKPCLGHGILLAQQQSN